MSGEADDRILEEILAALDRGEEPNAEGLARRFPGSAGEIPILIKAARFVPVRGEFARDAARLPPGTRVADFEIVRPLDHGGSGTVYVARQLSLGRTVALKVLRKEGDDARARFEREARLPSHLHHPHLCEVYAWGQDADRFWLAMELVEGGNLETRRRFLEDQIDQTPLERKAERKRIVRFIAQIADGLAALHQRDLVHRDVKPANVVLASGPSKGEVERAVLVDFGLVRPIEAAKLTITGFAPGTPRYAAPEQLLEGEASPAADIYALGVTLRELLVAIEGGESTDPVDTLAGSALEPSLEDPDLAAIVRKATESQPRWRYPSGREMREELYDWLNDRPVGARTPPLRERFGRWVRGHPRELVRGFGWAVGGVTIALCLAAVGAVTSAVRDARAADRRGDLLTLVDRAAAVPGLLRGPLLGSEAKQVLDSANAGGSAAAVVERLLRDDLNGARFAAATALRVEGWLAEPALARFWLRSLPDPAQPGPFDASERRSVELTARLLYEREPRGAELLALRPTRDALRRVWSERKLAPYDELVVVSALSGCGDVSDVETFLAWGFAAPRDPERERLTQCAGIRILARSLHEGDLPTAALEALQARYLPIGERLYGDLLDDAHVPSVTSLPVCQFASHLGFALRSAGVPCDLGRLIPAKQRARLDAGEPMRPYVFHLLAVCGDPLAEAAVRAPLQHPAWEPWALATACFAFGLDPDELRAEVLQGFEGAARDAAGQRFDAAYQQVAIIAQGSDLESFRPDPETLLGAPPQSSGWEVLAGGSLDTASAALSGASDPPAESQSAGEADLTLAGKIDLTTLPAATAGIVRGARTQHASQRRDERSTPYLLFNRFGESRLELVFELPARVGTSELDLSSPVPQRSRTHPGLILELGHQAAARAFYPFSGQVDLVIELDGKPVARPLVTGFLPHRTRVGLPAELLGDGLHTLLIRTGVTTNTTYRLQSVELSRDGQIVREPTVAPKATTAVPPR